MNQKIGIIVAFEPELKNILNGLEKDIFKDAKTVCGCRVWESEYKKNKIVVCESGIGVTNAAATTQLLISKYNIDLAILYGVAGNISSDFEIGDVCLVQNIVLADADNELISHSPPFKQTFSSTPALIKKIMDAPKWKKNRIRIANIATTNYFIDTAEKVEHVRQTARQLPQQTLVSQQQQEAPQQQISSQNSGKIDIVAMEDAGVAHVAEKCKIPFLSIRTISDNADKSIKSISDNQFELHANNSSDFLFWVINLFDSVH